MSQPDEELKKAFAELQERMIYTAQKLKLVDVQMEYLERVTKRTNLTIKQIDLLPPNTRTYEAVGRMFLLNDIESIKKGLESERQTARKKITILENSKTYLQDSLKESENNLRGMVQQKQNKDTSG